MQKKPIMSSSGHLATASVTTTMDASANDRKSASQIIAEILRDASKKDEKKKPSSSKGATSRIALLARMGSRRSESMGDEIQDSRVSSSAAPRIKPTRRTSYSDNDNEVTTIPLSSTRASRRLSETVMSDTSEPSDGELEAFRAAAGKYSNSVSKSTGTSRRASYGDSRASGSHGEEQEKILAAAGKRADGVSRSTSRRLSWHKPKKRTSYEQDLANSWKPRVKASSARNRATRRASYNDVVADSDDDEDNDNNDTGHVRHKAYSSRKAMRRASYGDSDTGNVGYKASCTRRGALRRASYNDVLNDSDGDDDTGYVGYNASPTRSRAMRRASYNDALIDSDDDDDYVPRRRVSFTSTVVESVHVIPIRSKQERREMFYRTQEIKQFRMDTKLERELVVAYRQKAAYLYQRSSSTGSIETKEENVSTQEMIDSSPKTSQQKVEGQANEPAQESTVDKIPQAHTERRNFSISEAPTCSSAEPATLLVQSDSSITDSKTQEQPTLCSNSQSQTKGRRFSRRNSPVAPSA